MKIDLQLHNGRMEWPQYRDRALRAEGEGYTTLWVFDHLDGQTLGGDRPMLECFSLLGALAAATSTVGIGSMVMNVANRHPAVAAAAAVSVQRISGGRLILGIGAGAAPGNRFAIEQERRGIPLRASVAERHAAVAEQIAVLRGCDVAVPVIVGVNSDSLALLAGELADGVNVRLSSARAGALLGVARAAAGGRPFETSAYAFLGEHDQAREQAAVLGLDRLVLLDF
jgi:alkanesulfonate monooxygenase SsuD/methylene tetrahydromethanopterin reductase-like flavin-dependent oxidoreductase (luciferase family)